MPKLSAAEQLRRTQEKIRRAEQEAAELQIKLEAEKEAAAAKAVEDANNPSESKKRGRPNDGILTDTIAKWMQTFCTAFKGTNGGMYVDIHNKLHPHLNRTISLNAVNEHDATLEDLVSVMYKREHDFQPKPAVCENACKMFLSSARTNAEIKPTAIRVAHAYDEENKLTIYIDRSTLEETHRYIKIDSSGFDIGADNGGFYFIREASTGVLPYPNKSATFSDIGQILSLTEQDTRIVFLWCLQALLPVSAYVNLAIEAPSGTGKSTLVAFLRNILEPTAEFYTEVPLPIKSEDFMLHGALTHVLSYDNITFIPKWFNDVACRVSKGTEITVRTLYTNRGITKIYTKNPMIFSGIDLSHGTLQDDLLRRSLLIRLAPREENTNISERLLKEYFFGIHPQILGALCNALQLTLNNIDLFSEEELGNMPEFRRWAAAAGLGLGWPKGAVESLINTYQDSRRTVELAPPLFLITVKAFLEQEPNNEYYDVPKNLITKIRAFYHTVTEGKPIPDSFPLDATRCVKFLENHSAMLHKMHIVVLFNDAHTRYGNPLYMKLVKSPRQERVDNFQSKLG